MYLRKRIFKNPVLVLIVTFCFCLLTFTACKTHRGYDKDGNEIRETSWMETFFGLLLLFLLLAGLSAGSSVHGALDGTNITALMPGEEADIPPNAIKLDLVASGNGYGELKKPIEISYPTQKDTIKLESVFSSIPTAGDSIFASINPYLLFENNEIEIDPGEITDNLVFRVVVESDFDLTSNTTGTVKVKDFYFAQKPPEHFDHKANIKVIGKKITAFVDIDRM